MKLTESMIAGCFIADPDPHADDRGFFARIFCVDEFERAGLEMKIAQESLSYNRAKGTLRGLHYDANRLEVKLVRCSRGAMYDVVVDLRKESSTFGTWLAVELNEHNKRAVYIPTGCAHGFQTLVDETDVSYSMSVPYEATRPQGIRWDDRTVNIAWPLAVTSISDADRRLPVLREID